MRQVNRDRVIVLKGSSHWGSGFDFKHTVFLIYHVSLFPLVTIIIEIAKKSRRVQSYILGT